VEEEVCCITVPISVLSTYSSLDSPSNQSSDEFSDEIDVRRRNGISDELMNWSSNGISDELIDWSSNGISDELIDWMQDS
jgi:hypothetical protein